MATARPTETVRIAAAHRYALEVRVRGEVDPDDKLHGDHAGPER